MLGFVTQFARHPFGIGGYETCTDIAISVAEVQCLLDQPSDLGLTEIVLCLLTSAIAAVARGTGGHYSRDLCIGRCLSVSMPLPLRHRTACRLSWGVLINAAFAGIELDLAELLLELPDDLAQGDRQTLRGVVAHDQPVIRLKYQLGGMLFVAGRPD